MPFLPRPGADVYYEVHGSGPPLVFAHGLGGSHLSWWQQVPYFAPRYTCITFAHRGFAPSTDPGGGGPAEFAADLAALLDSLEVPQARFVAQSMGGWTCTALAAHQPERVRALVLASTVGTLTSPSIDAAFAAAGPDQGASLFVRGIHPAAGERMVREQPALAFLYREIDALGTAVHKEPIRRQLAAMRTLPLERFAALGIPSLFIAGEEDIVIPPAALAAAAAELPGARLARIPETGHSVYWERAETFNRLVADFLSGGNETPTGPASA